VEDHRHSPGHPADDKERHKPAFIKIDVLYADEDESLKKNSASDT